jgi:hypothetical protein
MAEVRGVAAVRGQLENLQLAGGQGFADQTVVVVEHGGCVSW